MKKAILPLLGLLLLCPVAYAHPGGTDANGGHHSGSSGAYHYHHGYPAHQHTGGICPYNFFDKTGQSSGTNATRQGSLKIIDRSTRNVIYPSSADTRSTALPGWAIWLIIAAVIFWPLTVGLPLYFALRLWQAITDLTKKLFSHKNPPPLP